MSEQIFNVVEHFASINGEGVRAGELAVFVRFRGCNLDCSYCDTRWANDVNAKAAKMSVSDIVKAVEDVKIDNVTLTGGEPLIQAGIDKLIAQLLISGRNVEIETNGSIDINKVRENVKDNLTTAMNGQVINDIYDKVNNEMGRLSMTADYKLAGSNMEQYMKLDNFNNLQSQDTVKFVVSSEEDLKRALEIIRQYNLAEKCYVYFSPVFGKIEPVTIVDFMKNNLINGARVQLQLHKFIWSPDKKEYKLKQIDSEAIRFHIRGIIEALGDDPDREGLKETPDRVARMYEEVFEGMKYSNDEIADMFDKTFAEDVDDEGTSRYGDMVVVKDIDIFSYCEHHIALMYDMKVTVAYVPKGRVIGLSKIARIADMVGKRLQLQERIGSDIADIICKVTGSEDVAVFIEGCHSCMTARGIKKTNTKTYTQTLRGRFSNESNGFMQWWR